MIFSPRRSRPCRRRGLFCTLVDTAHSEHDKLRVDLLELRVHRIEIEKGMVYVTPHTCVHLYDRTTHVKGPDFTPTTDH